MPRLPGVDQYECAADVVRRYIDGCVEIQRSVALKEQARRLPVKELGKHRKAFTESHNLYTPGVDHAIKLLHGFSARSRREWLRAFDTAREILQLDALADEQMDILDEQKKGGADRDLTSAVA